MNTTKRSRFKLRKPCSHMDVTFMDVENQVLGAEPKARYFVNYNNN